MKKLLLTLIVLGATAFGTQVRGTLTDASGTALPSGHLVFTLMGCTSPNSAYIVGFPSKPILSTRTVYAGAGGVLLDKIIGNDQILCSGQPNTTYWHVDPFNGSTPTQFGGGDFLITGSTWNFNAASTLTIFPASVIPQYVETNATGDQVVTIAPGHTLTFNGTVNIAGLTGGAGPGGPTDWSSITNKPSAFPPAAHTHPESDIVGLIADLGNKQPLLGYTAENLANKNIANGYAGLDGGGLLGTGLLPGAVLLSTQPYTITQPWSFSSVASSLYTSTGPFELTSTTETTPTVLAPSGSFKAYFKASVGWTQQDSSGVEVSLGGLSAAIAASNKYQLYFNVGSTVTWTGMPSALTEYLGSANLRQQFDMSPFTQFRLTIGVATVGTAGAKLRVQYSTDGGTTWSYLQTGGGTGHEVSLAATGSPVTGSWVTIDAPAKGDYQIRIVGIGGDGTTSPVLRIVAVQFE